MRECVYVRTRLVALFAALIHPLQKDKGVLREMRIESIDHQMSMIEAEREEVRCARAVHVVCFSFVRACVHVHVLGTVLRAVGVRRGVRCGYWGCLLALGCCVPATRMPGARPLVHTCCNGAYDGWRPAIATWRPPPPPGVQVDRVSASGAAAAAAALPTPVPGAAPVAATAAAAVADAGLAVQAQAVALSEADRLAAQRQLLEKVRQTRLKMEVA
jgi:hypothetical protein